MMKKTLIPLLIFMGAMSITYGQSGNDPLEMRRTFFGGYHFYKGDSRWYINQVSYLMKQNDAVAHKAFKSARFTNTIANIIEFTGSFMIGYPLGVALRGGDPNWNWALIGGGLVIIGIPIKQHFYTKARRAINIYNGDLPVESNEEKLKMEMSVSGNGLGINVSF